MLTSFEEHLQKEYGMVGTPRRRKYEAGYRAFKIGFLITQLRKKKEMSQLELAIRAELGVKELIALEKGISPLCTRAVLTRIENALGSPLNHAMNLKIDLSLPEPPELHTPVLAPAG